MIKEILCFHTCKNENSKEFILQNAPFHSNKEKIQWLGQGFYLWTDSDFYAHLWGKQKPLNGNYVITQFELKVEETEFLDLVGNVNHQLYFKKLADDFRAALVENLNKIKDSKKRSDVMRQLNSIAVSTVINAYRNKRKFPFKVVKAQDIVSKATNQLPFMGSSLDNATLYYPTRQQLVVYAEARHLLSNTQWYHPVVK